LENQVLELDVFGKHRAAPGIYFPGLPPQRPFVAKIPSEGRRTADVIVIDPKGFIEINLFFRQGTIRPDFKVLLTGKRPHSQLKAITKVRMSLISFLGSGKNRGHKHQAKQGRRESSGLAHISRRSWQESEYYRDLL
jgi:hypothetical protein